MRVGILGPLEVVGDDGMRRDPAATRQRRLLLALLVWHREAVPIDRLVDVVWNGSALPRDPTRALRTYVTRLRSVLDPEHVGGDHRVLVGGGDHYRLDLDGFELDALAFEADLGRATELIASDPNEALRYLDRGLTYWRGRALMEVADEHWAMPEAVRLEELRLTAVEHRLACLLEVGRHLEALGPLERHVREHPLRERPLGLLLLALDRAGRAADAADAFRGFRERLLEECGLDPSPALEDLHTRLLAQSGSSVFTSGTSGGIWNELPHPRTAAVGRDEATAAVAGLLDRGPVVTVTGVGGVGKSRLAVEVARAHAAAGGRVAFVELGSVTSGDDLVGAILAAVRLPAAATSDSVDGLTRVLGARPTLLVVDNCEHLLDPIAALVDRLTTDCPELTVLATSREPIGIDGEHVHRLASLRLTDAVEVFLERAGAAGARRFGPSDVEAITTICERLDGIPLAVELAAARTAHLPPSDIAAHLDERFWLLTGGRRAVPRQQTLRATMDWSYHLLDADDQMLLRTSSVFVGSFEAVSLAAVADRSEHETLDGLASLVAKSLVEPTTGRTHGRYRLLETVRLYGLERLQDAGELATCRRRHAAHYLGRALAHPPTLDDLPPGGGESTMCRIRLEPVPSGGEPDLADQREALDWFDRDGDLTSVGMLASRLATVLDARGFLDPARRFLGREDVAGALTGEERTLYLVASALHAPAFGDWAEELSFARAAMGSAAEPTMRAIATALTAQASVVFDLDRVPELVAEALDELPPDAHHARLLLRGQETLRLVLLGELELAIERLEAHAQGGDAFAAGEEMLLLHVLGDDERATAVPVPPDAEPHHVAVWRYRWPLTRALAAAARGDREESAGALIDAATIISKSPIGLLDHDVLIACAAFAYREDDHRRAMSLLAPARARFRSAASRVLFLHYRRLATAELGERHAAAITEVAVEQRPEDLLDQEITRLRERYGVHAGSRAPSRTDTVTTTIDAATRQLPAGAGS